jgi:thiamine biosynthesis lipoprotein
MKQSARLIILLLLAAAACRREPPPYMRLQGQAQGTTFSIIYRDSLQRDFSRPVDSLFRLIDRSMSAWDTASIVTDFNRNRPGVRADEHFATVFRRAREISQRTGGAFDLTVGPLVKAWGFSYRKNLPPPDSAQVDSLRALIGFDRVVLLENGELQKGDRRMELDFNAIAPGYTVDLIATWLGRHGVTDYMVELGGEVRAAGVNERGEPWQIGIDKPVDEPVEGRPLQTSVALANRALATSGSYRKFIIRDGKKYSHAIDPATGYPITHRLLSVSVLAPDCTAADGYATAFLVMGTEKALALAPTLGLDIYCIYLDEKENLQVAKTAGWP